MDTCKKCGTEKCASEMYVKSGKKTSTCKDCKNAYQRMFYSVNSSSREKARTTASRNRQKTLHRNREFVAQILSSGKCVDCGEKDPLVLEFDHVRGEKHFDIGGRKLRTATLFDLQKEIDKCDVRCANCHRRRTYIASNSWRCKIMVP